MTILRLGLPQEQFIEASNLLAVIDAYIDETRGNISPEAIKNYENHLRPFQHWWNECPDQHHHQLSKTTLRNYVTWLETEHRSAYGVKPSNYAITKSLALVRRVLRWAFQSGCVPLDISQFVPSYDPGHRQKYYPENTELAAIVQSIDAHSYLRDTALWAFMLATGCRRAEVVNAERDRLTFNTPLGNLALGADHSGYIHLRRVKGDPEGKGKGRYSVFDSATGLLLKVQLRSSRYGDGSIFGLGEDGIRMVITDTSRHAGIDRMHPHATRSAFISHWADQRTLAGPMADIALRLQVGHSLPKGDAQPHYLSDKPAWVLKQIRAHYTTPMNEITIDWHRFPVHIPE